LRQQLSEEHVAAVNRGRRVSVQFDIGAVVLVYLSGTKGFEIEQLAEAVFDFIDDQETRIDSVWWDWCEGNEAVWPSRVLPSMDYPLFNEWAARGIDPVRTILDETKRRGLEAFFAYRINGSDTDTGKVSRIPMKDAHPEWLIHPPWNPYGLWDFAIQGVRDYKLSILRELAEDYDFDGIEIDFARVCPVLPAGRQWESREALTDFMRSVRSMLLEVEEKRGRPFLLAARVPDSLEGCHFDGMDVEAWAREQLVDIFVLGSRSFDVDIPAFRRITSGTDIKLYPTIDDHHSTDGYRNPPIEVFRGVLANWWSQGADGVQTFNWHYASPETQDRLGIGRWDDPGRPDRFGPNTKPEPTWVTQRQVYRELVSPQAFERKDKTFVVQRRGGGHGPIVVPNPEAWYPPRWSYHLNNMLAPLPVSLRNDGKVDTMLTVAVADDVATDADAIDQITIHLLISDPAAEHLPDGDRLDLATIATMAHPDSHLGNVPAAKGIEDQIELRLNNALLDRPTADQGWLIFKAQPGQLAVGNNLIGLRVSERPPDAQGEVSVEKLEVHVTYR
jgi:hypothetical protein